MEWLVQPLRPFLLWLWQSTLIASLVICLILVAQRVLGKKLGPRWSHALWLVLLLRMIVPWAPPSQISLLNLVPSSVQHGQLSARSAYPGEGPDLAGAAGPQASERAAAPEVEPSPSIQKTTSPEPKAYVSVAQPPQPAYLTLGQILPVLWLLGAALVGVHLVVDNFALWRIVKRERPLVEQATLELFEECKTLMGIQTLVAAIPTSRIESPALFGFLRPRLLLPRPLLDAAGRDEMRYVFLHELAHLKRHDIYLGWVTSLLQVLHWFNPLVWFAFHRMRLDRELACDALVLTRTGPQESQEYGRAIVALLRRFSRSRPAPALAGILENQSQLKRRIAMITQFQSHSYRWSPAAVLTILVVACLALPGVRQSAATAGDQPAGLAAVPPATKPSVTMRLVQTQVWDNVSLSPDGRYLCGCGTWVETGEEIVIRELATGARHTLKPTKRTPEWTGPKGPVLSPDNKRIAYYAGRDNVGRADLCLIEADGSGQRVLYPGVIRSIKKAANAGPPLPYPGIVVPVQWFPDGNRILGLRWRDPLHAFTEIEIVSVAIVDGSVQVIKTLTGEFYRTTVRLSPDAKYVAYEAPAKDAPAKRDLFAIEIGSQRETPLVVHAADDRLLDWTPDGSHILFISDRLGPWSVWLLPVAQGTPELVAHSTGDIRPVGFARDGSYYYRNAYHDVEIHTAAVNLTTGQLLSAPARLGFPGSEVADWSPDGRYLAYCAKSATASDTRVIRIRSLDTGRERELPNRLTRFECLRWSPDGRALVASWLIAYKPEDVAFRSRVYRIDVTTGEATILLDNGQGDMRMAELSPDGKILYYTTDRIIRRELDTAREQILFLYPPKGPFAGSAISPNGQFVAVGSNEGTAKKAEGGLKKVILIPAQGGEAIELLRWDQDPAGFITQTAWSPDGKTVLFTLHREPVAGKNDKAVNEFWQVSIEGGPARKIMETDLNIPYAQGFRVHPDGQRIIFSQATGHGEIWVMENFLPTDANPKGSK